jgi:hypothetical protein
MFCVEPVLYNHFKVLRNSGSSSMSRSVTQPA